MGEDMETREWNKLQLDLFCKLMVDNDISLVEVIDRLDKYIDVWDKIFNVLIESSEDIDKYSSLRGINLINKDGVNFIFIKLDIWDYIIIDIDSEKVLSKEQILLIFDEEFFINNLGEKRIGIDNYYFTEVLEHKVKYILYTYINNEELLNMNPFISYYICEDNKRVGIEINLIKGTVTLCFNDLGSGRANYLFFDKKLKPIGVSNPSGNMDELKKIADKFKGIMLPLSVVKDYLDINELKK